MMQQFIIQETTEKNKMSHIVTAAPKSLTETEFILNSNCTMQLVFIACLLAV